ASSVIWSVAAQAATRPHYGGTLRVAMRETPQALDPLSLAQVGAPNISRLLFDTLVVLDGRGQPQPALATSWQAEPGNQRWRLTLRSGVLFNDGASLEATAVAASLRSANPDWKVLPVGDMVIVQTGEPHPNLPAELALPRNGIVHGNPQVSGTGPFAVAQYVAGKHLSLVANDQYWGGRPFVDSMEIDFGQNDRDQMTSLDLGRIDLAEVAPENIRRARSEGHTVESSSPSELMVLAFANPPRNEEETHLRTGLALSIDTSAINNVVLQGGGESTGALLPNWLSGYGFLFAQEPSIERARTERALAKQSGPLVLAYDPQDTIARTVAERILLNARDAGITVQLTTGGHADMALTRVSLPSLNIQTALTGIALALQLPTPNFANASPNDLYLAEKILLQSHRVIPLVYLRSGVALQLAIRNFNMSSDGAWQMNNVWLGSEKP
ncbi:MAG TPA: ABC transporter substrate-binding protein, partial [Terriglobales bacterium]|nr:ABC transporter substrate-binding protein [Terriglobales bacterium]